MADPPSFSSRSSAIRANGLKLPRDLSGEELCRVLKRMGFEFVRQTGSHRHYVKEGLHPCVPMHREHQTQNVTIHFEASKSHRRRTAGEPLKFLFTLDGTSRK